MLMLRFTVFLCFVNLFYADNLVIDNDDNSQFTYLTDEDFLNARIQKLQELLPTTRSKRSLRSKYEEWKKEKAATEAEFSLDRFEGDIMHINGKEGPEVNKYENTEILDTQPTDGVLRNAIRSTNRIWPTTKIPYQISTKYKSSERTQIAAAIEEYSDNTCIEFIPRTSQRDYLQIIPDDGCYSNVGRAGGRQIISLEDGCFFKVGTVIHELMHSLGFFHEQSRTDRDDWIEVKFENILSGLEDQFQSYSSRVLNNQSFEYDYSSVMHYPTTAFTKNGRATIVTKKPGVRIGQRDGLSPVDIQEINKLYCDGQAPSGSPSPAPAPVPAPGQPPSTSTCTNQRSDCDALESKYNLCEARSAVKKVMNRVCAKTCNQCPGDQSAGSSPYALKPCKDNLPECSTYLSLGYCTNPSFSNYMASNCMKSCNVCPK